MMQDPLKPTGHALQVNRGARSYTANGVATLKGASGRYAIASICPDEPVHRFGGQT